MGFEFQNHRRGAKAQGGFLFLISYSMFLILFFLKKLSIPLVKTNGF
ncbi:hypothetical protein NC99_46000 [Sunxiuqinia dokdonensis]|uniref:Uncharacterized protein n=1 Tax=Sunxiuqinia dokdonensis TaxID=1409788 RepID=A0A0L8V2Z1_9BACT|nr:hypothetical protein NC99_46000 [Sunxiuqinia dokdonensis]